MFKSSKSSEYEYLLCNSILFLSDDRRLVAQTLDVPPEAIIKYSFCNSHVSLYQGDTPKNRAEKAHDAELAAYLENRQHYQMIQREDQETAV